jgi:hypothetical protein
MRPYKGYFIEGSALLVLLKVAKSLRPDDITACILLTTARLLRSGSPRQS